MAKKSKLECVAICIIIFSFFYKQEEELRASNDPKYQHLQEELHTEITAFAPPAEAHARIAYALTEVRKYLIPDSNDDIRQEQMREMEILTANGDNVTAAALAATMGMPPSGMTGTVADPTKRAQMQSAVATAAAQQPAASLAGMYSQLGSQPNLAMMHPAFRPNLSMATHQSIQVINCLNHSKNIEEISKLSSKR